MNIKQILVPRGIEYLSDVLEVQKDYKNDLPHNSVISKQLTGVGGTSLVLTNDEPYVIAVHLIEMIKCKVAQHPEVFGVFGEVSKEQIQNYITSGGKKIMVTYDSVPKVQEALGSVCKDFRLLVDEYHKMIAYLGSFKPSVCIKLLERNDAFKSVSYLTATPTNYKYLPKPMKSLDIVEFDWESKTAPNLVHCHIKEGMVERTLSTLLDRYDNSTDEVYIFYNSRAGVVSLLKKLFKCKKEMTLRDINIMFSQSEENTKFFKKHLGSTFSYGTPPDGEHNHRINIISSMGFEGIDFYPNHVSGATPVSIIVSDPDAKSMRFDINVDIVQILGRFRKNKVTGKRVDNPVIYLWNTQKSDYNLNETEFLNKVVKERTELITYLEENKDSDIAKRMATAALKTQEFDDLIASDDGTPMVHPYGMEAKMSAYQAMHSDSSIMSNLDSDGVVKDDSVIVTKLSQLDPNLSTYSVPLLPAIYTKALGRTPSVRKMIEEYEGLLKDLEENYKDEILRQECQDRIDNFLITNTLFAEWINSGITTAVMRTNGFSKSAIIASAATSRILLCNADVIKRSLRLKVGNVYTGEELLRKVVNVYQRFDINNVHPKASDIRRWHDVKRTTKRTKKGVVSAYQILS